MANLLSRPPERLHHHAYVVRDQEANRRFFEDTLGIPLTATWCERHFSPWVNREVAFCHTFYSLGDGGALAFFAFADNEVYQKCQAAAPPEIGAFYHVAFKVDDSTYEELVGRLKAAGEPVRETDHGYCRSMYCTSPDGLIVEFTVDLPEAEEIGALRRADAHAELARWVAGDHRTNNDLRAHAAA
ncbi:MAG TPA: VOC family protein [Rhodopila sp.]|jgi:catechol 2,3-dioxygenase-like lactoylglutathione lyase family enzyme|nr:VOC family protein [Rhodopila sp.]